jgi:DNA helicase HerA-like ATPase
MIPLFTDRNELAFGRLFEVAGAKLKIALDVNVTELVRSHEGRVYPIGQVGSIVKMFFGRRVLFAVTRLLRLQTPEEVAAGSPVLGPESRVIEADLLGEGIWDEVQRKLLFERGTTTYPLPMQPVFIVTSAEARALYEGAEATHATHPGSLVPIGSYMGAVDTICRANIDKMFGSHCAVLGSTGTGKSTAVAAILHGILDSIGEGEDVGTPRIVLIDPHGEYAAAFGDKAQVFRAYSGEAEGDQLVLPYWLMSSDEFRSLVIGKTEFEATSQSNVIHKALAHARMAAAGMIEPAKDDWLGQPAGQSPPDAPRPVAPFNHEHVAGFDRDRPNSFSLEEFQAHIENEQALREVKGVWQEVTDTEFNDKFSSILDKLRVLRTDARLSFLMRPTLDATLERVLSQLVGKLGENDPPIRIVDISGLPNEVAGPLTAALARLLFQYKLAQSVAERQNDPILMVCEEAHRYVPDKGEAQYAVAQGAIRRIAREGRKYGLGLMLVSQRPADVESTVISQCSTWVILRLTNSADQQHVSRFLPDSLAGIAAILPSLPRREALFVGEGAALPARIRLRYLPANQRPRSDDISFAQGWASANITDEERLEIATRMSALPVP